MVATHVRNQSGGETTSFTQPSERAVLNDHDGAILADLVRAGRIGRGWPTAFAPKTSATYWNVL